MASKQEAVAAYLSDQTGPSRIFLTEQTQEYQFDVWMPGKEMTHRIRFDRLEFDRVSLPQILAAVTENEIAKAMHIAPFALEITLRNGVVHAAPRSSNR